MHFLHYVVTRANSGKEACSSVESEIESWGDEDNWRVICGAISEKNIIYNTGEGRWLLDKNLTIKDVNKNVRSNWFELDGYSKKAFYNEIVKVKLGVINGINWWAITNGSKHFSALSYIENRDTFDVLTDEFKSWELDENGITHLFNEETKVAKEKAQKIYGDLWVVFIDMHT